MGLLQVDGYLHIDEDSRFYNIGATTQSITYQGETIEFTGLGELIVGPNASVLLESELKNRNSIDNAGTFDINIHDVFFISFLLCVILAKFPGAVFTLFISL